MGNIKEEMMRGVFWSAVGKYSGILVQICISAVLARLISPAEFGVVAIASVLIAFLNIFSDLGIGAAIIQRQDFGKKEYDAIFSFSLYLGLSLSVIFFFSAYLIASFYENPELRIICQILSVNLFFGSINMVPNAIISKQKRFKFIAQRTLFFQFSGGILAIIAAMFGWGCYALLIAPILSSVGCFAANYRQYPLRLSLVLDISPVKSVFSYSSFLLSFNVMNYFTRNLDKLIIGKYFSLQELGYYEKSYHLMMLPLQQVTHVVTPVMHPILTSLQNDYAQLAKDYAKILKFLSTISFPLGVFLYFAADNLIYIIYGEQWMPSVPIFEILTISVPFQMLIATTGSIFQSAGRTDWQFYAGTFHSCITVVGFFVAALLFHSMEAMAWAFVITMTLQTFLVLWIIFSLILKESFMMVIKSAWIPFILGCAIFMILLLLDMVVANHVFSLVLQIVISSLVTFVVVQYFNQYDLLSMLKHVCNSHQRSFKI